MVSAVIAVSGAMGWLLAYMQFNDMAITFVHRRRRTRPWCCCMFSVVMIVLGTFVDSLAILLVFAPVAIELCKRYGIDPIQMGLVMVMCNQIGAVSPPTAPLLFVTTNIAKATVSRGQPPRLVVHARRIPGAAAGDLRSRAVVRGFRTIFSVSPFSASIELPFTPWPGS